MLLQTELGVLLLSPILELDPDDKRDLQRHPFNWLRSERLALDLTVSLFFRWELLQFEAEVIRRSVPDCDWDEPTAQGG